MVVDRQHIINYWKNKGYEFDIEADTHIMFVADGIEKFEEEMNSTRSLRFKKGDEYIYVGMSNYMTLKVVDHNGDFLI